MRRKWALGFLAIDILALKAWRRSEKIHTSQTSKEFASGTVGILIEMGISGAQRINLM
jgi:hypothetical protein